MAAVEQFDVYELEKQVENLLRSHNAEKISELLDEAQLNDIISLIERTSLKLSLIHISEPTRPVCSSRMPSSA